eukprot:GHVR01131081.1.p1 GENE.GHVR01131081.1~~GHVR01131081.1.p1  ORF type:complete len:163 (+),score=19.92 GHVR01131081.1:400-888(+)
MFKQDDPWEESDTIDRSKNAIIVVHKARKNALRLAEVIPRLKSGLAQFEKDLERIEKFYIADPRHYRRTRSLTAVHLPAIMSTLDQITEIAEQDKSDRYDKLCSEIEKCLLLSSEALKKLNDEKLDLLEVSIGVLTDEVEKVDTPQPEVGIKKMGKSTKGKC